MTPAASCCPRGRATVCSRWCRTSPSGCPRCGTSRRSSSAERRSSGRARGGRSRSPAGPHAPAARWSLDLGRVECLREVALNGRDLGVPWCAPFQTEINGAVRAAGNRLEIKVVNLWPNRIIGDAKLPPASRLTRTNITRLTADGPLEPSGLLGPVRLLRR